MSKRGLSCGLGLFALAGAGFMTVADAEFEFFDPPPWQETAKSLPAYPADKDLLRFEVDSVTSPFEFFIDQKTLTTTDDGVVGYTVAVVSDSGAKNVLREGIRCQTKEFRIYAYGQPDVTLKSSLDTVWQKIPRTGPSNYRDALLNTYVCDANFIALDPEHIIRNIRHPPNESVAY